MSGNHLTFGDGATSTTYPTKLSTNGYSYDGGDYLKSVAGLMTGATKATIAAVVKVNNLGSVDSICSCGSLVGTDLLILQSYTGVTFFAGGGSANNAATFTPTSKPFGAVLIGVSEGTRTSLFVNGVKQTDAVTPVAISMLSPAYFTGGCRSDASLSNKTTSGNKIKYLGLWNIALTDVQAYDLSLKLRKYLTS